MAVTGKTARRATVHAVICHKDKGGIAMRGKLATALSFAAALLVAQAAAADQPKTEVDLDRPALSDIQAALLGQPARPGLLVAGKPFEAKFHDVALNQQDALQLKQIVQDAAMLPPDSEVHIRGAMGGKHFNVEMQNGEHGRKEARLDGLMFSSREDAMQFLDTLRSRGVQDLKLDGYVQGREVHGRIDHGKTSFEG